MTSSVSGKSKRAEFDARRRVLLDPSKSRNPKARTDRETAHPLETDTALPRTGVQHYAGEPKAPRLPVVAVDPLTPAWRARAPRVTNVQRKGTVTHIGGSR
jgi:hypothetical protein